MIFRFALVIAGLIFTQTSSATEYEKIFGAISGGGGKGVVCRSPNGTVNSVQLLDLWEGQVLYNEYAVPATGDLRVDVNAALIRLKDSYELNGTLPGSGGAIKDQDIVLESLRYWAKDFLDPSSKVLRLRDVKLTVTDDSYELAKPADCEIEQIVNFQPTGRILMNMDLFDKMDPANQAALIVHEAFYKFLRNMAKEANSIRVRRAIGYVFSGKSLVLKKPTVPTKSVECFSNDVLNQIMIFEVASNDPNYSKIGVVANWLDGSKLIGLTDPNFSWLSDKTAGEIALLGKCPDYHSGMQMGFELSGPVEFDRTFAITWRCQYSKLSVFIENTKAGTGEKVETPLTCIY